LTLIELNAAPPPPPQKRSKKIKLHNRNYISLEDSQYNYRLCNLFLKITVCGGGGGAAPSINRLFALLSRFLAPFASAALRLRSPFAAVALTPPPTAFALFVRSLPSASFSRLAPFAPCLQTSPPVGVAVFGVRSVASSPSAALFRSLPWNVAACRRRRPRRSLSRLPIPGFSPPCSVRSLPSNVAACRRRRLRRSLRRCVVGGCSLSLLAVERRRLSASPSPAFALSFAACCSCRRCGGSRISNCWQFERLFNSEK
jgi:hypothetical protein